LKERKGGEIPKIGGMKKTRQAKSANNDTASSEKLSLINKNPACSSRVT